VQDALGDGRVGLGEQGGDQGLQASSEGTAGGEVAAEHGLDHADEALGADTSGTYTPRRRRLAVMAGSNHTWSARASELPGGDDDHVRIEDMILVTEDAARVLGRVEYDETLLR
jgi:hypothetical protein